MLFGSNNTQPLKDVVDFHRVAHLHKHPVQYQYHVVSTESDLPVLTLALELSRNTEKAQLEPSCHFLQHACFHQAALSQASNCMLAKPCLYKHAVAAKPNAIHTPSVCANYKLCVKHAAYA